MVAIGGYSSSNNKVEIFDIQANTWTLKTEIPFCSSQYVITEIKKIFIIHEYFSIFRYGLVSLNSSVIIFGGRCDGSNISSIFKYTIDQWEQIGNLQSTRYGSGAILNGNRIFIIGGEKTQP